MHESPRSLNASLEVLWPVHITALGMDLLAELDQPILDLHRGQMKHMTRAELAELNRLLEKLRRPVMDAVVVVREKACSP
ncbi:MAG: hypothetical protein DWH80_10335 [Planctomycetota bacterium]|nr:MAG: hypothetical protein DWH80_10335 [Planctomycetota bacterium]